MSASPAAAGRSASVALAPDFMYEASTRNKPLMYDELPRNLHALHHSFGFEVSRRNNLHLLDTNTALFISGNAAQPSPVRQS